MNISTVIRGEGSAPRTRPAGPGSSRCYCRCVQTSLPSRMSHAAARKPSPPVEAMQRAPAEGVPVPGPHAQLNPGVRGCVVNAHDKSRSPRRALLLVAVIDRCGGTADCGGTVYLGRMLVLSAGGRIPRRAGGPSGCAGAVIPCRLLGPARMEGPVFKCRGNRAAAELCQPLRTGTVYTPQVVVDGQWQAVGSDPSAVEQAIGSAARSGRCAGNIGVRTGQCADRDRIGQEIGGERFGRHDRL